MGNSETTTTTEYRAVGVGRGGERVDSAWVETRNFARNLADLFASPGYVHGGFDRVEIEEREVLEPRVVEVPHVG